MHGGRGAGLDALEGLREDSPVVVHYTVAGSEQSASEIDRIGDEGLRVADGVVTRIDRGRKLTIKFDNGKTATFRLTDRASADADTDVDPTRSRTTRVIVYYSDESGRKIVHFFKKTS